MNDYFIIYIFIALAGMITYLTRVLPVLIMKKGFENSPSLKFLEYSSYAFMGGMISLSILKNFRETAFASVPIAEIITISIAFIFGMKNFNAGLTILISLITYVGLVFIFNN